MLCYRIAFRSLLIAISLLLLAVAPAAAKERERSLGVPLNGSRLIKLRGAATQVSVGNSEIVKVNSLSPTRLLVTGQRMGHSEINIWTGASTLRYSIQVELPVDRLQEKIQTVFSGESINVETVGEAIVLSGQVSDAATSERAKRLVEAYIKGLGQPVNVLNFLAVQGEQQVQLRVKVAELSRSSLRQVGANFWHRGAQNAAGLLSPGGSVDLLPADSSGQLAPAGTVSDTGELIGGNIPLITDPLSTDAFGLFFVTEAISDFPMAIALNLLQQHGLAKVLAEPTLVTYSGSKASFISGGEFPVPIPQSLGQIAIEYKKFGVQLEFTPTVMANDTMHMDVGITVSDQDERGAVTIGGLSVPVLTNRQSSSTIRLKNGQSFAVAGLLQEKLESFTSKVPLLGEIPLIGMFFRRSFSRRSETELVVLVTANIVQPLRPGEVPPLPGEDEFNDPDTATFFLLGHIDPAKKKSQQRGRSRRGPAGPVGFAQ